MSGFWALDSVAASVAISSGLLGLHTATTHDVSRCNTHMNAQPVFISDALDIIHISRFRVNRHWPVPLLSLTVNILIYSDGRFQQMPYLQIPLRPFSIPLSLLPF